MGGFHWVQPTGRRQLVAQAVQERQDAAARIEQAIAASTLYLGGIQAEEGYWCGELTADCTLESDYILLQLWLHQPEGATWNPPTQRRIEKACQRILSNQQPDGGWWIYPGGPSDLNATVKAYTALKLGGMDPDTPVMLRAYERVRALGGVQACNSYTKINLSLFGLYPRHCVPSVPPEVVLLPGDILYEMSSWTRTILVPLSIVQAVGRERRAPYGFHVDELRLPGKRLTMPNRAGLNIFFHHLDRVVKLWEKRGIRNVRAASIREAEHWLLDRTRYTEGVGAIFPAMMYTIMALESLGYPDDHPDLIDALQQIDKLLIETDDRFQIQPCVSPVWDTAYAVFSLGEAGQADPAQLRKAANWLVSKEVRRKGDWSVKRPDLEPSGWAFEFANEYYPDIDDTAMVLLALRHAQAEDPERQQRCTRRAVKWLLGMQSCDGGWAAFDVDNNWQILNRVPFADHNAMLDPSCPDITGRVLEALTAYHVAPEHPQVQAGVRYLLGSQEADGSWYGRWGVNYLYGTFLALRGLQAVGSLTAQPAILRAAEWLRLVQNRDGGWGESCASYQVNRFVPSPSTASQTAWALLGLAACGDRSSTAVRNGIRFLLETQRADGSWDENLATGTGFPNVFYLTYHLYRQYFPLLALAQCRQNVLEISTEVAV